MKILDKLSHSNKKLYLPALIIFLALVAGLIAFAVVKNQPADKFVGICHTVNHQKLCAGNVIGLNEARADEYIHVRGFRYAVVNRDGKSQFMTLEADWRKLYIQIHDGIVVDAHF